MENTIKVFTSHDSLAKEDSAEDVCCDKGGPLHPLILFVQTNDCSTDTASLGQKWERVIIFHHKYFSVFLRESWCPNPEASPKSTHAQLES